jgi:hypothetical protein
MRALLPHVVAFTVMVAAAPASRAAEPLMPAEYLAFFENLDDYPDYAFFIIPGGVRVRSPNQGMALGEKPRLVAVPAALHKGADKLAEEWLDGKHPGVATSDVLLWNRKSFTRSRPPPQVIRHYRITLANGGLECVMLYEVENVNSGTGPVLASGIIIWILSAVLGGAVSLALVIGLVTWILIRRVRRARP